jgi:hypothetical protein
VVVTDYASASITATDTVTVTSPTTPPSSTSTQQTVNTCALYGQSGYSNNWISINLLVILISLTVVSIVYSISSVLPANTRSKLVGAVKSELTQILLSGVIIAILVGSAQVACNLSAGYSSALTGTTLTPFQYADSYIGNLAAKTGIDLLTNLYSYSVAYQVAGQIVAQLMDTFGNALPGKAGGLLTGGGLSIIGSSSATSLITSKYVTFSINFPAIDTLAGLYTSLSDQYIGIFATFVTMATGMLFLQYLVLIVMQYVAFTVVLPASIIMRSLAFTGTNLRRSANALLALAIAAYLIYPLMVALDYSMFYFALQNAGQQYQLQNVNPNGYFSSAGLGVASLVWDALPDYAWPWTIVSQAQQVIEMISQYLFQSVVLFAINIAVTVGFATGLANALNSGIEGAGSFWSGI